MRKATGLGKRLAAAMQAADYGDEGAEYGVQIMRFSLDHRIPPGFLYKWLSEESVPSRQNIIRLAEILGTTPGLLLFGPELEGLGKTKRRPMHPVAGGSDAVDITHTYRAISAEKGATGAKKIKKTGGFRSASYQTFLYFPQRYLAPEPRRLAA